MREIDILLPNLALCEWGDAGTESVLADLVLCRKLGIGALGVSEPLLPVACNIARETKIYCLTNNAALAERPGATMQLIGGDPNDKAIAAFELKDIKYTDWGPIIMSRSRGAGFLFIDQAGQNLHRFYEFLNLVGDFSGEIQYCAGTNDPAKVMDARRIVAAVRPEFLPRLRLFVSPRFDFGGQNI
ncbi:MAG: hypothetical protein LBL46_04400 [Rickettsiales bacterium]|jgi:hypothetical protein|nr:hypothetical protein [Rickettsiales bacterium]